MKITLPDVGILMDLCNGTYMDAGIFYNDDHDKHLYVPIPEAATQQLITPRSSIAHTNADTHKVPWYNLWRYVGRTDIVIEPHFQIEMSGLCRQFMPVIRKADCNYKANLWWEGGKPYGAVSFETQDEGSASLDSTPWTVPQMERMIEVNTWLCIIYDMECTATTSVYDSGIGYHSQFPEWSAYKGKTCPGKARIQQMDYIRLRVTGNVMKFHELRAA